MSIAIISYADLQCCQCGVPFGLSDHYAAERSKDHRNFFCPNGHEQAYLQKSEADQLRDRLAEKERALTAAACREANERAAREKVERKLKRTCVRVKAGVCPCCNRTVKQLADHMATKHPEFKA